MRKAILAALALGVTLAGAGCGSSVAAPAAPVRLIPATQTAPVTVPPVCTSTLLTGCVPPLCDVIGNVVGCIPDGPNYQGLPSSQPVDGTNTGTWGGNQ